MKLRRLVVSGFRCYRDATTLEVTDFTALLGRNDAGKSTLMDALDAFFGNASLDGDDRCKGCPDEQDVVITCEFEDFPDSLVLDTAAPTTLAAEYLLNKEGRLAIKKVFSGKNLATSKVYAVSYYPTHPDATDILSLKIAELKALARRLNIDISGVSQNSKPDLRGAIWAGLQPTEFAEIDVTLEKDEGKDVWEQISPHLPVFALFKSDRASRDQDDEAQEPLKAAVRIALKAKEQELAEITGYVENQVREIANDTLAKLREMDPTLASQLHPRIKPGNWDSLFKVSISGDEGIPINKRGSGVRRLILLNFFRAQAEKKIREKNAPNVIYAIEEPETSQHPHNQRILLRALLELLQSGVCQVIVTTHTPTLAKTLSFEQLRYVHTNEFGVREVAAVNEANWNEVANSLGVMPDHSVRLFIGVEGPHDVTFLCNLADALIAEGHTVPNLRQLEIDGHLIFFPQGGSTLAVWKNKLHDLNRPEFRLYDRDNAPPLKGKYEAAIDAFLADPDNTHAKVALQTSKRETENYLHIDAINASLRQDSIPEITVAGYGDFDDIPELVAVHIHLHTGGGVPWVSLDEKKRKSKIGRAKARLNNVAAKHMTLALLQQADPTEEPLMWFSEIQRLMDEVKV